MSENKFNKNADPIESAVAVSKTPRMRPHEIAWMIAAAARLPAVMILGQRHINRQMFHGSEPELVLLWQAVSAAAKSNEGILPADPQIASQMISLHVDTELGNDPNNLFYTPSAIAKVTGDGGYIDVISGFKVSEEIEKTAIGLMARFLTERVVSDPVRRAVAGLGTHDTMSDPASVLSVIEQKARELIGLGDDPGGSAFVPGFVPKGRKAVTTKSGFLDRLMNGGHADGEAVSILGPSSGGKTALLVQLMYENAQIEAAVAAELAQESARQNYYFTYELTRDQLLTRFCSYGAKIDINSFNQLTDRNIPLSTAEIMETIKEYEREVYVNSPGNPFMGERERKEAYDRLHTGLGNNVTVVDFSGDRPGHGDGGIAEIVGYLRRKAAEGKKIGMVVVDYAGLVVNRYVNAKNMDPKNTYQLLAGFGNQIRSQIAIPFRCKAWVAHQLHGTAAKKKYGKLHSSDALGCRNFADNFDFGIEFNKYDETTGLVEFSSSKHRHAAAVKDGPIARFDGRFGAFIDPAEEYVRDPSTGQIVPRAYLSQVAMDAGPSAPHTQTFNPWDGIE